MPTSASGDVRFVPASDSSLLVYLGDQISLETHRRVAQFLRLLESQPVPGVRNLHPAYCSVLIRFDPLQVSHANLQSQLEAFLKKLPDSRVSEPRQVEIPVCYDDEFGPDLNDVAEFHNLTTQQVIDLHVSVAYTVFFFGFVPGFAYLGQLPADLITPRLSTPRRSVAAGSVGIAGSQTGVYPFSTPGGWRLLGRTPIRMFRPSTQQMNFLSVGDQVRFMPISRERFHSLEIEQ